MVIFRPPPRFPKRPQLPPDEILPDGWSESELDRLSQSAVAIWSGAHELRKLQIVFARVTAAGVDTDPAICTQHFLNLTGGVPDSTWVDADFTAVESAFDTFWGVLDSYYTSGTILDQYRWYKDGPAYHPTPAEGNPAVRVIERNLPGVAASTPLPPQVAVTITEKTALRRRWGRIYLPAPAIIAVKETGLVSDGMQDVVVPAFHDFYEACVTADIVPVVWSPTVETSYQIEHIQMDDLFDVIRSRRWKSATRKVTGNIID